MNEVLYYHLGAILAAMVADIYLESGLPNWKPVGKWNRYIIFVDRHIAVFGGYVFTLLYSTSIFIVPLYFFAWYMYCDTSIWAVSAMYLCIISSLAFQCLMSYLREVHFYDSYGVYAYFGACFSAFLITVIVVSLSYMSTGIFGLLTRWHIAGIAVLHVLEAVSGCASA